jgi:hypothetical protein
MSKLQSETTLSGHDGEEMVNFRQELAELAAKFESVTGKVLSTAATSSGDGSDGTQRELSVMRLALSAIVSSSRKNVIKPSGPAKFSGVLPANSTLSVSDMLEDWLLLMNRYISQTRDLLDMSDDQKLNHYIDFFDGKAGVEAVRALNESESCTWNDIESAVRRYFNGSVSSQSMLCRLKAVKQMPNEKVMEYYTRFRYPLDAMIRAKVGDKTTCADVFVSGMSKDLREWVDRARAMSEVDVLDKFGRDDVSKAIQWIADLAQRGEAVLPPRTQAAINVTWTRDGEQAGRASRSKRLANEFGVSVALINQRFEDGVCAKCGERGHGWSRCKNKPVAASVPAKVTKLSVAAQSDTGSDPKAQAQ